LVDIKKDLVSFATGCESWRGQTTKEGVYSRHETVGSFTKNWHSSNQLTGLSFPRIKRGRARARKVVYFRARWFSLSLRYEIPPRPSAFVQRFSETALTE